MSVWFPAKEPLKHTDRTLALRLSLFYGAYFVVMGVQLPFWPTWLEGHGLSKVEIGVLVSVGVWARTAVPLFAHWADLSGERRRPMVRLAWASAAVFALFAMTGGFWWLFAVSLVFGLLYAPILALGESLTLLSASGGVDYGRVRLWGSLTFIAAAVLSGLVLEGTGAELVLWLMLAMLIVLVGSCHLLPDTRPSERHTEQHAPYRSLLGRPMFWVFLSAAAMSQASHALYYGFSTLHWRAAGHHEGVIGWLWAEGVLAEIVLFACGAWFMRRFGAVGLLILGGVAGVVRWLVTAWSTDLAVLICVQPLHALTYGATHLGAIRFITESVRSSVSATAQSLYGGLANGAAMGCGLLVSGYLYQGFGGRAFAAMAVLSGLGGVAALALGLAARRGPIRFR